MLLLLMSLLSTPASGDIQVIPITHASLILKWDNMVIHVDPWSRGNYEGQPQADLILVTDTHGDHLDSKQVVAVSKEDTIVVGPQAVQETISWAKVLSNGETGEFLGVKVEAMPMYNLKRGPSPGHVYHPKGRGNGYVLTLGDTRVYISGDTACIPEMKELEGIDIAFICMNLPYTMTPEEAAACVNEFRPKVVYPYHYRGSDLQAFKKAVTADGVEVIIADWYR
jgi:L-ascorbate metabolism protein UlaG (beta-lactamase superfamily)